MILGLKVTFVTNLNFKYMLILLSYSILID